MTHASLAAAGHRTVFAKQPNNHLGSVFAPEADASFAPPTSDADASVSYGPWSDPAPSRLAASAYSAAAATALSANQHAVAALQGGLLINLVWDSSVANAPSGWKASIQAAATMIQNVISTPITVNIAVGYGEIGGYSGGSGSTVPANSAEGGTLGDIYQSYTTVRQELVKSATSADDASILANLASASPYGSHTIDISGAQAKAFGLVSAASSALDGEIGFATNWPSSDLIAAALHEITHAMGRNSGWGGSAFGSDVTLLDLMRFSAPGVWADDGTKASTNALQYFSVDGGRTAVVDYSTSSDYGDTASNTLTTQDPYNAYVSSGSNALTTADLRQLDAMGFTLASVASPPTNAPDLVVSVLTQASASVTQGSSLGYSFAIADIGPIGAATSTAAVAIDGTVIASFSVAALTAGGSASFSGSLSSAGLSVGTHTLSVTADSGGTIAETNETNNITSAVFTVSSPPDSIPGDTTTNSILTPGTTQSSMIDVAGDQDWFRVTLTQGHTYTFEEDAATGSSLDSYLRLLTANGSLLAFNDDIAAGNLNSRITYAATTSATCYVSAQGYSRSTGAYVLSMTDTPPKTVTGATVAQAAGLQADVTVASFAIVDSAAHVANGLAALVNDTKLTTIMLTDTTKPTITLSQSAYTGDMPVLAKITSDYNLVVTGATVAQAIRLQPDARVSSFTVTDSWVNVGGGMTGLIAATKLSGITLSDVTKPSITLSQAAYTADAAILAKIGSPFTLMVTDATVAQAANLQSASAVSIFSVADTVADVQFSLSTLNSDNKLTTISVSGTSGSDTLNLIGLSKGAIVNLGGNTASVSAGLSAPSLTFINQPDQLTMGSGATTVLFALQAGSGVEEISKFQYGLDQLDIDLRGAAATVLKSQDTTVGGAHAISIYSSADPTHGIILLGITSGQTAANMLSSHTSYSAGHAIIT